MPANTTLYYPYIHPRRGDHIKAALIYWDRVRRIVPSSVIQGDAVHGDDRDSKLLTECGLLVSTSPEPYEDDAARRFLEHLEPKSTRFQIDVEAARDMASRNHGIHVEKMGGNLLAKLQDMGLAHRIGDWVSMHDSVGAFYMFCLASEMAKKMSAPLFTDSSADAALGEAFLFEPDSEQATSAQLLRLGIQLPSPNQLTHVPMATIVEFAQNRVAEKQAFRAAMEGILQAARSKKDPHAIDDYFASERLQIESSMRDLRQVLDEVKVGKAWSIAKITVPAAITAALPFISAGSSAILAATGISLSLIACHAETRGKLRKAKIDSPYHYLVSIEKDLRKKRFP